MQNTMIHSINYSSKHPSLWLLAAAICLYPAAVQAQTNTATGTKALFSNTTGHHNTADGYYALYKNNIGGNNTASGANALYSNTSGRNNTASGFAALRSNTTGDYNTASGTAALYSNTTGTYNTASGNLALSSNTTGHHNTASGVGALKDNTTGSANTAGGNLALSSNTTGENNTASGSLALYSNTTGWNNVAVGAYALAAINGSNNIALGIDAGKNTPSGNSNIYIGHTGSNGGESRVIRIGRGQIKTFIAGIAGRPLSGNTVVVKSNGQLGIVASSARYKQDIKPLGDASAVTDKLAQLRPVSFRYKAEPEVTHYGLIAEEVDKVMPELVVRDEQNRPDSVQYQELVPLLLQQWKAQQAEIARLHALIEHQEAALTELRRMFAARFAAIDRVD